MDLFQQLGREVEDLWRAVNYDEEQLPSIAADALRRADIPSRLTAWDVLEWGVGVSEMPRQRDITSSFGDPPITIYSGLRFHIDVYFWFDGTTSIHQHAFCGAFQVMHGSSIHSWYTFDIEKSVNKFVQIGTMHLKMCELLNVGDVQEILAGQDYIHSLFHLEQPSATIVIRTDRSPLHMPQYNYHKPKLAIDPFFEQDTVTKKMQIVSALIRAKRPNAESEIGKWLAECDFQTTFVLLSNLRHLLSSNELDKIFKLSEPASKMERMIEIARKRHGDDLDVLLDVFARQDTLNELINRRRFVTDPEQRFFMALLLNVDGKERIYTLIKQRFPDADPQEKVLDWTLDLANTRIAGTDQGNALGIAGFGDVDLFVLEQILNGKTGVEIEEAFKADYGDAAASHDIAGIEAKIRAANFFRPLLK